MANTSLIVILDYKLYKDAGVISRRGIRPSQEEEGEEIPHPYSVRDVLDRAWKMAEDQGTCLSYNEFCLLKADE